MPDQPIRQVALFGAGRIGGVHAPSPSGEDGRRALLLAEAAYRSLETGQRVSVSP